MKDEKAVTMDRMPFWLAAVLVGSLLALTTRGATQTISPAPQGEKAVWSNSSTIVGSVTVIDASAFCTSAVGSACSGTGTFIDFCQVVQYALTHLPMTVSSSGVVLDARGIVPAGHGPQGCSVDPFNGVSYSGSITLLLPPTRLEMHHEWRLPSNTRIVGEGALTNLQAQSNFTLYPDGSNAIVEMGAVAGSTGVAIEHLVIDGTTPVGSIGLSGIYNANAQDSSYVNDVTIRAGAAVSNQSTTTTGLFVGQGAANSGPYSDVQFVGVAHCTSGTNCTQQSLCTCRPTACVKIQAQTRGLHGITCIGMNALNNGSFVPATTPAAAIYLDASSNTIEDVHVEGFFDGVVVGDNADGEGGTVTGNTLTNVVAGYGNGPIQNTVHICNPNFSYGGTNLSACSSSTSLSATDLSILDAESIGQGSSNGVPATTIQDDLTGTMTTATTINSSPFLAYVGKYVLGEPVLGGGNPIGWLAHLYVFCKGGGDEVGDHSFSLRRASQSMTRQN